MVRAAAGAVHRDRPAGEHDGAPLVMGLLHARTLHPAEPPPSRPVYAYSERSGPDRSDVDRIAGADDAHAVDATAIQRSARRAGPAAMVRSPNAAVAGCPSTASRPATMRTPESQRGRSGAAAMRRPGHRPGRVLAASA